MAKGFTDDGDEPALNTGKRPLDQCRQCPQPFGYGQSCHAHEENAASFIELHDWIGSMLFGIAKKCIDHPMTLLESFLRREQRDVVAVHEA